jgi:hypothetical protein
LQRQQIDWPLNDANGASVATGLIPTQERLGPRESKIARQILNTLQEPANEPYRLAPTNLWKDDSARQPFAAVAAEKTNAPGGRRWDVAPS